MKEANSLYKLTSLKSEAEMMKNTNLLRPQYVKMCKM